MNVTMFDSVNVDNIPPGAKWVAGYVNGLWPTYHALLRRHPHAHHVSITINAEGTADVLDVEQGDATPQEAVTWVERMRELGRVPVVYCSRSNMPVVQGCFFNAKVAEPFYWVADFTGEPHLVPGSVATQWANGTSNYPGLAPGCDTSLVSPNFPKPTKIHLVKKVAPPVKFTTESLTSIIRQLAAYAGIATQIANTGHLPTAIRTAIVTVSGVLLSVEHYAAKPTVPAVDTTPKA